MRTSKVKRGPNRDPAEMLARPEVVTRKRAKRVRDWCIYNGIRVPAWVDEIPRRRSSGWENCHGRNTYTAAGCWCELRLALFSGMDCYWENAMRMVSYLGEPELEALIEARSPDSVDVAFAVCRKINPAFATQAPPSVQDGRRRGKKSSEDYVKASEQRQNEAWRDFCRRNGISPARARFIRRTGN